MNITFLLFDGVTALDVVGPYESLRRLPDVEVTLAASTAGPVKAGGSMTLVADCAWAEVDVCDVLLIPGGSGPAIQALTTDEPLLAWVRERHPLTRWTTSVCTGAFVLGAAGLLNGLRATTHWRGRRFLSRYGAEYSGERLTEAGRIITAAGVSAGIDLGLRLCELIAGSELAQAVQLSLEYEPAPPFGLVTYKDAPVNVLRLVDRTLRN